MKSGLKYRMVEIIPQNRINKKIKIKKMGTSSDTCGTTLDATTFPL